MAERIKRIKEEIVGVVSVLGSFYLLISLITHYVRDPVLFFRATEPPEPVQNLGGIIGAYISGWLFILFGLAAFIIPLLIIAFGIKRILGKERHNIYLLGGILFIISSSLLFSLLSHTFNITIERYPDGVGGLIGRSIAYLANRFLAVLGAYIFSLSV
ncbi:MAG: DNA translocase FtsK 4TM domain-containing protein, partial [Nitrospirota bacterium]